MKREAKHMNSTFIFLGFCCGCNTEHQKFEIIPFDYTIKFYFTNSNVTLFYSFRYYAVYGPEQPIWYNGCLRAERSGVRKQLGGEFYRTRPERPCRPTASCTVDNGPLSRA